MTRLQLAIIDFFKRRNNEPAMFIELLPLGSAGGVSGAVEALRDDGILEWCTNEAKTAILLRLTKEAHETAVYG